MGRRKYTIGIDFGTLSGRAVLVDTKDGSTAASAVCAYAHGVMETALPDGTPLGADWALQHPGDYLDVLFETIPAVLRESGVRAEAVIGIGVDFTSCTVVPAKKDGTPLCMLEPYRRNPHAYVKLWKHHAAQRQADALNRIARERGEPFLARCGGKVSSEWMLPKLMEICEEAPEVYQAADRFLDAADWVCLVLTGKESRSASSAGYKALWHKRDGYPSAEFFKTLHPLLEHVPSEKLGTDILPQGARAGCLSSELARRTGLLPQTAVSVGNIDAHVALPSVGITEPGKLLMIMGTSTCDIVCSETERLVPGTCGVVEDGVLPGFYGYEAGQPCVGDMLAWFVENQVPASYKKTAAERNISVHALLSELAARLSPGESGLLALDWWNGNRSVLVDSELSGLILGLTLATRTEEIYRALIEATAFGQRVILEAFETAGVSITELYACGGITKKNPLMMQVYADVCGREIRIGSAGQSPALGAAMFGAVAAGSEAGGYDTIFDAARAMGQVDETRFCPDAKRAAMYEPLFQEYKKLHEYFGRGGNDVMKTLRALRSRL
ncbi:MAG: ribulokinase [Lachnospiraceae bacterium]|nr:ribulokinase [Lachnospiraceae bacterium]